MMENTAFDKSASKEFFKHLVIAYNKKQRLEKSKERLNQYIEKAKKVSADRTASKKKVEQEFKKLEKQIKEVIELEQGILKKSHGKESKEIKSRIEVLEKKIDKYTNLIESRRDRIKKLEDKIKHKVPEEGKIRLETPIAPRIKKVTDSKTLELRNKLFDLQEKYYELKTQGIPKSKLKIIEQKIKKLKEII